jgi:hypothetical protein
LICVAVKNRERFVRYPSPVFYLSFGEKICISQITFFNRSKSCIIYNKVSLILTEMRSSYLLVNDVL